MRTILVLSQNAVFDLGSGAGKEVIYKTLNELSRHFKIILIAPGSNPQIRNCEFYNLPDYVFNKLKRIPIIGYLYNFIHYFQLHLIVRKTIWKHKINPDLIYLAGPWMSSIGHSLYENKRPIIVRYFGVNWRPNKHYTIRQKLKFYLKNKGYRKFGDLVIMTNDGTRGDEFLDLLNCPKDKLLFLPNGIDFIEYPFSKSESKKELIDTYGIPESNSILLTVSRLATWKRVDRAILGLKHALKYNKKISLLIVGDGEERLNLQHLVQTEGLHEHVHFTGSIKHNNLGKYYAGCDLFLSLYDYSNAGNPLFEAMMNRCAIVTIDSPAMKYFISEKSAFLLKESSPETVGLVIQELILDKERLLKYGLNAENEVKKNLLRWDDRIALEINKIIELSGHQKS